MEKKGLTQNIFFSWLIICLATLFLLGLALLAPLLRLRYPSLSQSVYAAFAPFCHQIPERCFWFMRYPLPLCARCLGTMTGFFLGTLLFPFFGRSFLYRLPSPRLLLVLSVPLALDIMGNLFRWWNTPNWPRFGLGLSLGIILPFYFIPGMINLISQALKFLSAKK